MLKLTSDVWWKCCRVSEAVGIALLESKVCSSLEIMIDSVGRQLGWQDGVSGFGKVR